MFLALFPGVENLTKMFNIPIRYINKSLDPHNENILIFLRNEVKDILNDRVYAWKVIKNCGIYSEHHFVFSLSSTIVFKDPYGNFSQPIEAIPGDEFQVFESTSGTKIKKTGHNNGSQEIQVTNELNIGSINILIKKDGRTVDVFKYVAPGQKVVFKFKLSFWVTTIGQIEVGKAITAAVVQEAQRISLHGIESADLIKVGGGPGPNSKRITFSLENTEVY